MIRRQVDNRRSFPPVVRPPAERQLTVKGALFAVWGPLGWLDQHDVGPQGSQDRPGELAPMVGEVQNAVRRQHAADPTATVRASVASMASSDHDHADHADHADVPSDVALRAKALQSLLVEKGIVEQETIDRFIEAYEHRIGPHLGARLVARAWTDAEFLELLRRDGNAAALSLDIPGLRHGARLIAVENDAKVHNLVVCTLCSCYPTTVLGMSPVWYKSAPFRSRAVRDPRGVLAEFGTVVADDVEVRVWDSNSEVRYIVVPQRPTGTDAFNEEQLAALVSRNAMIGVERANPMGAGA